MKNLIPQQKVRLEQLEKVFTPASLNEGHLELIQELEIRFESLGYEERWLLLEAYLKIMCYENAEALLKIIGNDQRDEFEKAHYMLAYLYMFIGSRKVKPALKRILTNPRHAYFDRAKALKLLIA